MKEIHPYSPDCQFSMYVCYIPQLMDQGKLDWKVDWEVTDNNNLTPWTYYTTNKRLVLYMVPNSISDEIFNFVNFSKTTKSPSRI